MIENNGSSGRRSESRHSSDPGIVTVTRGDRGGMGQ